MYGLVMYLRVVLSPAYRIVQGWYLKKKLKIEKVITPVTEGSVKSQASEVLSHVIRRFFSRARTKSKLRKPESVFL